MSDPRVRFDVAAVTHVGMVRQRNEDAHIVHPSGRLWLVADGMGGHTDGRYASDAVVEAIGGVVLSGDLDRDFPLVETAIYEANRRILDYAEAHGARVGTTVVGLMAARGEFVCVWAGDSRAYLWRGGELIRISRDHTQVQEMLDRGLITPEQAKGHPMGHVLSRAVGVEEELELEAVRDAIAHRDVFLLCSDGLTAVVREDEIAEALSSRDPQSAANSLVDLTLSRGAPDNVTVIAVSCEETTALIMSTSDEGLA
jgi:serine/threonine protein phosphatase Stp1